MKYLLLIHGGAARERFARLGEEEQSRIIREYLELSEVPGVLGSNQLHPADTATTVRVGDGRTLTTDGPFIEAKLPPAGRFRPSVTLPRREVSYPMTGETQPR